jgi:hypothetical protein
LIGCCTGLHLFNRYGSPGALGEVEGTNHGNSTPFKVSRSGGWLKFRIMLLSIFDHVVIRTGYVLKFAHLPLRAYYVAVVGLLSSSELSKADVFRPVLERLASAGSQNEQPHRHSGY